MKVKPMGYHTLPNGIKLHFSINAWYNLEQDCGSKASEWLLEFGSELQKKDRNEFILLDLLVDLCLAAGKAYAQEEDKEFNVNRFKLRSEMVNLKANEIEDLASTIFNVSTAQDPLTEGKQ